MKLTHIVMCAAAALFGAVSIGSACDTSPDQCTDSDTRCDGNVAAFCNRPPDTHRELLRTTCTDSDICLLDNEGIPFCGVPTDQCPASPACDRYEELDHGCVTTQDGGLALAADSHNQGCPGNTSCRYPSGHVDDAGICQ